MFFNQFTPNGFDEMGNPIYNPEAAANLEFYRREQNRNRTKLILAGIVALIALIVYFMSVVKKNHKDVMMSFDEMADLINLKA